jgi:hypothetical protein
LHLLQSDAFSFMVEEPLAWHIQSPDEVRKQDVCHGTPFVVRQSRFSVLQQLPFLGKTVGTNCECFSLHIQFHLFRPEKPLSLLTRSAWLKGVALLALMIVVMLIHEGFFFCTCMFSCKKTQRYEGRIITSHRSVPNFSFLSPRRFLTINTCKHCCPFDSRRAFVLSKCSAAAEPRKDNDPLFPFHLPASNPASRLPSDGQRQRLWETPLWLTGEMGYHLSR